jgi:hypothetical protein
MQRLGGELCYRNDQTPLLRASAGGEANPIGQSPPLATIGNEGGSFHYRRRLRNSSKSMISASLGGSSISSSSLVSVSWAASARVSNSFT